MLDDLNDVFYRVDYEFVSPRNRKSWVEVQLHTVQIPAIIFHPDQWQVQDKKAVQGQGYLVAVEPHQQGDVLTATMLGAVHISPLPQEHMSWGALEGLKGAELPAEMKAGLLRKVFDRRPGADLSSISYVTPSKTLRAMESQWHRDGVELNYQLDSRFAGGRQIEIGQKWRVYVQ
jgi:hypothetical protein